MSAAVNFVLDSVVISLVPGGADDGAFTAGTPVTVLVDKFSLTEDSSLEDHSPGQQKVEHNRLKKKTWSCEIDFKLDADAAERAVCIGNELIGFTVTGAGVVCSGNGIKQSFVENVDAPSTAKLSLKCYGTDLTWA